MIDFTLQFFLEFASQAFLLTLIINKFKKNKYVYPIIYVPCFILVEWYLIYYDTYDYVFKHRSIMLLLAFVFYVQIYPGCPKKKK